MDVSNVVDDIPTNTGTDVNIPPSDTKKKCGDSDEGGDSLVKTKRPRL